MKKKFLLLGGLIFILAFGGGFFAGMKFAQKRIAQRPSFDEYGFVKSVQKTISGKVLEVGRDFLVLTKNQRNFRIKIDPKAKITITKLSPTGASPSGIATPGAIFVPPPEIQREAKLEDIRVGDRVTVKVVETPDGRLLGRVISVERK